MAEALEAVCVILVDLSCLAPTSDALRAFLRAVSHSAGVALVLSVVRSERASSRSATLTAGVALFSGSACGERASLGLATQSAGAGLF